MHGGDETYNGVSRGNSIASVSGKGCDRGEAIDAAVGKQYDGAIVLTLDMRNGAVVGKAVFYTNCGGVDARTADDGTIRWQYNTNEHNAKSGSGGSDEDNNELCVVAPPWRAHPGMLRGRPGRPL